MALERFDGAWTALVTPFAPDASIHWAEFERLVAFQIDQGITGILPVGTTGESPTLDWDEHHAVIDAAIRLAKGKCFVLAGTGSNATSEALRGSRHAAEAGADAVLLVDCYYNGPSSLELRREYYAAVAHECPNVFIVPYVIPGRSGTALAPEDLAILDHLHPNIRSVKEATGDLDRMRRTRSLVGDDFDILSGDDPLTATMMTDYAIRASGVVSVITNVVPAAVEAMTRAFAAANTDEGNRLATALEPLANMVTVPVDDTRIVGDQMLTVTDKFRNPLPIKTLMRGLGMLAEGCRRPLGRMTAAGVAIVRRVAQSVWDQSPELLEPVEKAFGVSISQRLDDDALWSSLAYPDEP